MVDIIQPLDFLGRMGGMANMPNLIGDAGAITQAREREAATIDAMRANAMANQAQAMEAAQKQARAQQFQSALVSHLDDGSPQSTARLMKQFPEFAKQLGDAHALEKADVQEADTLLMSDIYSRAANGDWAGAAANAKRRLDAEKAAGNDTTDEQELVDALSSGDPALQKRALGIVGMDLAARVGLEKFASVYGGVTTADGNVVDRGTGRVIYQGKPDVRGVVVAGGTDEYGNPQPSRLVNPVTGETIGGGATGNAAPVGIDVVDAIISAEGTAKNPNSSAVGVGQFVDGTWIEQFKAKYPSTTLSVPEILKLKNNPKLARDLTAQYAEANAAKLGAAGVTTDNPSIYLAHFLGPQDAIDVLRADPATPVSNLVAPASIAANKSVLDGKTAGDVRQWAAGKVSAAPSGKRELTQKELAFKYGAAPAGQILTQDGQRIRDPLSEKGLGKTLPTPALDKLNLQAETTAQIGDLIGGFQDGFSGPSVGNATGATNLAGRMGAEGYAAQADWWQRMGQFDNVVRNELFGASLTAGEQAAWKATTVTPTMAPARVRANLAKRREILDRALARKVKTYGAAGYNIEDVGAELIAPSTGGWSVVEVPK